MQVETNLWKQKPVRIAIDLALWGVGGYMVISWLLDKIFKIDWLNDFQKALPLLAGWCVISVIIGLLFSLFTSINEGENKVSKQRTLIRITGENPDGILYAVVPGWRPETILLIPASVGTSLLSEQRGGRFPIWLLADVNLSAGTVGELQLSNIELAPDPVLEEELS